MVTILKCACGRVDSLRNRVQGLQPPETAYNTQESHQHPRDMADLHSTAPRLTPERKNKVQVGLSWSGTGRWTWHQNWLWHRSQPPPRKLRVHWWPGGVYWIRNETVSLCGSLATVTKKHRIFLSLNWWRKTQRARPFSGKAAANTSRNRDTDKVLTLSDFMEELNTREACIFTNIGVRFLFVCLLKIEFFL